MHHVWKIWGWKIWLAVAAGLTILHLAVDHTPQSKLLATIGVGLTSLVLLLLGVWANRPSPVAPWLCLAGGLGSLVTADVVSSIVALRAGTADPPVPDLADLFRLAMYPLIIMGLIRMVQLVAPRRGRSGLDAAADAAIVGGAMLASIWVLFADRLVAVEGDRWGVAVSIAYPVLDVVLVAVAMHLVVATQLRHPPFTLLLLAAGSLAVADAGHQIHLQHGTSAAGLVGDALWLLVPVGFAVAALHPGASGQPPEAGVEADPVSTIQLAVMSFAALGLALVGLFWADSSGRSVTIAGLALLSVLILARMHALMTTVQVGQDRLRHHAEHDSLTGLVNRVRFAARAREALTRTDRETPVAVLFIDLDDFKTVNDSLGHRAGDQLLVEVAARLGNVARPGDTVARFGGDEFAVLLESAVDRGDAVNVARRALDAIGQPIDIGHRRVRALASIGIAMDLDGTGDAESLMRNADVAMYLSKSRGKGRFEFFEPEMHEDAVERLDLKADLQRAIEHDQFELHYQPIFDLKTGRVREVEALIRWKHPNRGTICPEQFIALAEENGLIVPIGEWVIREACHQAAQWHKIPGCEDIGVSVNLSARQLQDDQLINTLTNAIAASGIVASRLVLEITESMLAIDADASAGILGQLKTIGVKLAIDDFGAGYSSLSYLKAFPVDAIKIDRSFINELHRSSTSSALVEAVVNLSRALGAYTVAEGIEYSDQAGILRRLGCDRGQGFYYCRPLGGPALTALLREHLDEQVAPLEAWRRQSEEIHDRSYDIELRYGLREIEPVAGDIDELVRDLRMPVMASWAWLRHWSESFTHWTPMMVEVRMPDTRELAACAMLAIDKQAPGATVVAMGHSGSLYAGLPARDPAAAKALARATLGALNDLSDTWALDLEQIPDHDPTLRHLNEALDNGQLLPELRVPRVVFSTAHNADQVLSKSRRKQLRKARNRIEQAGLGMVIAFDRGRAISSELLDEVEAVHVSRDRHSRRNSDLDRPAEREFWRRVVGGGNEEWEIEIATLRLDGELAAYSVAILDGEVYRMYDGRMATEWRYYSPGRLVEAAALSRALSDQRFAVLDWMSGIAAEKLLTTNFAEARMRLVATSGSRGLSSYRIPIGVSSSRSAPPPG